MPSGMGMARWEIAWATGTLAVAFVTTGFSVANWGPQDFLLGRRLTCIGFLALGLDGLLWVERQEVWAFTRPSQS